MKPAIYVVGLLMGVTAGLALALTPRHFVTTGESNDLEKIIPRQFASWDELKSVGVNQIATATVPGDTTLSDTLYDKTISRSYRGQNGEVVMLAAAYGARQNDDLKVHRPEVCYVSQGFQIVSAKATELHIDRVTIPVMQLVARNGARIEPITYWIRVGDTTMRGGMAMRLAIIKAGLLGSIPDGLLMRVSTIVKNEADSEQAFKLQNEFLTAMMVNEDDANKAFLLGKNSLH